MKKLIAVILMVCMVAALFTGCAKSSGTIAQPSAQEGAALQEITGSCEIEKLDESTLRVNCTTNLIQTTKIAVMLDSYNGENLATKKMSVEGESFSVEFEIEDDWTFPITASIVCAPTKYGKQLSAVKDAYGSKLQNVTGEHVIWNTESNLIVISSEEFNG